jgi:hypothetical protein
MQKAPNPILHLSEIIEEALKSDEQRPVMQVIALAMGESAKSPQAIKDFYKLLFSAEGAIDDLEQSEEQKQRRSKKINDLLDLFMAKQSVEFNSIKDLLSTTYIDILHEYSDVYNSQHQAFVLEKDFLEALSGEITSLINDVKESSLDSRVKIFLIKHLESMQSAVNLYSVGGIRQLLSAIESGLGSITFTSSIPTEQRSQGIYKKILSFFVVASNVLSSASNSVNAIANIEEFASPRIEDIQEKMSKLESSESFSTDLEKALSNVEGVFTQRLLPPSK